jgi:hypothetical protein
MYVIDENRVEKEITQVLSVIRTSLLMGWVPIFSMCQKAKAYASTSGGLDDTFEEQGLASNGQGGVPSGITLVENRVRLL